jgi:DNA topoisomerase-1
MATKTSKFGAFLGCTRYPDCKTIKPLFKKTGVKCPVCKEGDIVERKSKKGRIFYGCNRYPDCKAVLWAKPTGELCPKCQEPLVVTKLAGAKRGSKDLFAKCSNKEWDFEEPYTKEE